MCKKINETGQNEIKTLRVAGISYKEIARKVGVSVGTAYKYARDVSLSDKARHRLVRKIKENQAKFAEKFARQKDVKVLHERLTLQKARIIGHCMWDGSVACDTVRYNNTSRALADEFVNDMKEVYGISPDKMTEIERSGRMKLYVVDYYSKKICDDLYRYTPTYSTKDDRCTVPNEIMKSKDKRLIQEFLRSFWEDEGSISHNGWIRAKIKGRKIRDQLMLLHRRLGIKVSPYEEKLDGTSGIYVIIDGDNIRKFADISFKKSLVVRGMNKGKLKFDVLNSICKRHLHH